jgi:hypothetical protein
MRMQLEHLSDHFQGAETALAVALYIRWLARNFVAKDPNGAYTAAAQAQEIRERILGPEHPLSIQAADAVAVSYDSLKR